ncbi:MAG: PhoX family phosphatase [Rhodospirillales bacterium]
MTEQISGTLPEQTILDPDDRPINRSTEPTLGDVIAARFRRRDVLKGALGITAIAAAMGPMGLVPLRAAATATTTGRFPFEEIGHGADVTHHVSPGYAAEILIRWGDPVVTGAPDFDPATQSAAAQDQQFGYNCDYVGFVPLPQGAGGSDHGLLCVNHEYTNTNLMFPGVSGEDRKLDPARLTREHIDIELAAHGGTVVEIRKTDGRWAVVKDSPYNRRVSMLSTPIRITGPAAGHERLKTAADPTGTRVIGTLNNCAGGITPWGTYLTAEENFHQYFVGETGGLAEQVNHDRYGVGGQNARYPWGRFHDRFDVGKEPNEANRFGWIVEIDPYAPASTPLKRTALGRFKHEGAESIVNKNGRVVVYSGDDQRFEYVYRFVTDGVFDAADRAANMNLLDHGTLSVAKFHADGTLEWLPLVHGSGPLTAENGFASQADVLIETRRAADLLGATPMDRPEDVEPSKVTQKVYVLLTNNARRTAEQVDAANPRAENTFGHIIELTPPDGDHAAPTGRWEILVSCGDPSKPEVGAFWNPATTANGWFAAPDNCAIDPAGRLWVATDQGSNWAKSGTADGVWALETEGALRGTGKMFFRVPVGAEMCGPLFTPDGTTLFVAVQHPGSDGVKAFAGFERDSTFEDPATRWPDFADGMPPRPSVVAITKQGGGVIAG